MKTRNVLVVFVVLVMMLCSVSVMAATEQAKQQAIDDGLEFLASTMATSGSEGYWSYAHNGTLAATGSAALAFIEEGYLPGSDVIINGNNYGDVVGMATNYIFNRATVQSGFGWENAGYARHAEDYNGNGILDDGGNNQAIYFNPGNANRNVYTTGIVTPVIYALGNALGQDATVGMGSVTSSMTYGEVLRDVVDWFSYAQVEPTTGIYRGGWRYYANQTSSDNSTAQWGALPILYAQDWGMDVPDYVKNELSLWITQVQNTTSGGSGYTSQTSYVNMSKTGGLLLELAAIGETSGTRVDLALQYIEDQWNQGVGGNWYGNIGHPYAMWAVYKALEVFGEDTVDGVPGGIMVGQDWDSHFSAAGDWYAQYCEWLVNNQNANGSWNGYSYWNGALADGWYINILNAAGAPPPTNPVPEPATIVLLGFGMAGLAIFRRKKR